MDPWNPIVADAAKNPKHAAGAAKNPFHPIPFSFLPAMGRVMKTGAAKYGLHNWMAAGVVASIYFDAAQRHILAWWGGEDYDPESGEHHLIHAMCCCAIVFDCLQIGNLVDDRPAAPRRADRGFVPVEPQETAPDLPVGVTFANCGDPACALCN